MRNRVLLTRSKEANNEIISLLSSCTNIEFIKLNLINYTPLVFDKALFDEYSNLIITSNYVAKNILVAPKDDIFIWVVGAKSAMILENKRYKIKFIAPSVDILIQNLPKSMFNNMVYLSGDIISKELPDGIRREVVYKVAYLNNLDKEVIIQIKEGVNYLTAYSKNCAKTLLNLLVENNLLKYLENTKVIAISSSVGNILNPHFKNIIVTDDITLTLRNI